MSDGQIIILMFLAMFVVFAIYCVIINAVETAAENKQLKVENKRLAREIQEEKEKQAFLNSIR